MFSRLSTSHSASMTSALILVMPSLGSSIQKRSEKLIEESANAMRWQTGAGVLSTRGRLAAASTANSRT